MTLSVRPARRTPFLLAGVSLLGLTVFASAASAQSTTPDTGKLGEIVVTAVKRETNVQKTPIAVTAITSAVMQQSHIVDAVDLNGNVPSLVITTSEGFERNVAIRGVGFNVPQNDSAQPSVSYHVDGIYISNPVALNTDFLDVDHLEVVRGPQGTVYGQNSTGGTINVVTNLPKLGKTTGWMSLDAGTFDLIKAEGALNFPLGDTVAVRLAGEIQSHNGFANATAVPGTNGHYGLSDDNSHHLRASVLWAPTDRLSLMLRAEYAGADNHNTEGKSIYDPNPNPWQQTSDWAGKIKYKNSLFSGTLNYDLGFAKLKAMGSYQMVSQNGSINEDGLTLPLAISAYGIPGFTSVHDIEYLYHHSTAKTGEIDLASPTGKPLEWIVGAFYLSSTYHVGYDQYAVNSYPVANDPTSLVNQLFPAVTDPNNLGFLGADNNFYFPYFYSISTLTRESVSAYAQATYHITDKLRVSGGARYTHDHNTTNICDYACSTPTFVAQSNAAWTGKAGVEYDLADKTMGYFTFSTGFKPGGGNISPFPIDLGFTYAPETVRSYELGIKSTMLDNKLRVNLAGFYYDYHNTQFEAEDAVAYQGGVANIPRLYIEGLEAEVSALLPASFRFDGNLTLEKSKITSHFLALDNVRGYAADKQVFANAGDPNCLFDATNCFAADIAARAPLYADVYGNAAPNLPHVSLTGTLTHTTIFGDGSVLTADVQGQYRSSYVNAVYGDLVINGVHVYRSPAYTLWNAFIGFQPAGSSFKLSLVVKNLFNKGEVLGQFTNQFGGEITRQYAPPRQVIGSVSYKF